MLFQAPLAQLVRHFLFSLFCFSPVRQRSKQSLFFCDVSLPETRVWRQGRRPPNTSLDAPPKVPLEHSWFWGGGAATPQAPAWKRARPDLVAGAHAADSPENITKNYVFYETDGWESIGERLRIDSMEFRRTPSRETFNNLIARDFSIS